MSDLFGHTRARIAARHALITPGNHVNSSVPGFTGATTVVLINEAMGAKFAQLLVTFTADGRAAKRSEREDGKRKLADACAESRRFGMTRRSHSSPHSPTGPTRHIRQLLALQG